MPNVASLLSRSDYARTPWKNGLGFTDQIAIEPPTAELRRSDFIWRLSSARIERSAPFSPFPHHDRVLVVLEGAGARLSHRFDEGEAPELVDVGVLEPYEFPGDVPTSCELSGGPIQDLSVFFAKGRAEVQTETLELAPAANHRWEARGRTQLLFVVSGSVTEGGVVAEARDTLRIDLPAQASRDADGPPECSVDAGPEGARVVLVQINTEG